MKKILLFPLDLWFYVSSVCFQGSLYNYVEKPSLGAGAVGMCYVFEPIIFDLIRSSSILSAALEIERFLVIYIAFLFALLFWLFLSLYKSKKRGLRIMARFRLHLRRTWHIVAIWFVYMVVLIPIFWYTFIKFEDFIYQ